MPILCLIQFWDDWKDFRVPELQQLLRLLDIDGKLLPCPPPPAPSAPSAGSSSEATGTTPSCGSDGGMTGDVFQYLELPSAEAAARLCARSVLIKSVYEVWAHGESFEDLERKLTTMRALQSNNNKDNAGTASSEAKKTSAAPLPPPAAPMGEAGVAWGHYVEVVALYKSLVRVSVSVSVCLTPSIHPSIHPHALASPHSPLPTNLCPLTSV